MSKTSLAVEHEVRAKIWDAQMILMGETGRRNLTVSEALDLVLTEFLAAREAKTP